MISMISHINSSVSLVEPRHLTTVKNSHFERGPHRTRSGGALVGLLGAAAAGDHGIDGSQGAEGRALRGDRCDKALAK